MPRPTRHLRTPVGPLPVAPRAGFALLCLLLLAAAPLARADLIHLRNGKVLHGEVLSMDDQYVVLKVPYGKIKLRADQVEFVEHQTAQEYQLGLGKNLLQQRRYLPAIQHLQKAAAGGQNAKAPRRMLGRAYAEYAKHLRRGRRLEEAAKAYRKLLVLEPENAEARQGLSQLDNDSKQLKKLLNEAHLAWASGDVEDAIAKFERALAFNADARRTIAPLLARCHAGRAQALYRARRYAESAAALEQAFSLDPALANKLENLYAAGSLSAILHYLSQGQAPEARAALARVLTFAPANAQVLYIAGRLEEALSNLRGAARYYAQGLRTRAVQSTPRYVAALRAQLEEALGVPNGGARIRFSIQPTDTSAFAKTTAQHFETLSSEHFKVYYYNRTLGEIVGQVLEAHRARILEATGLKADWKEKPKVFLYRTREEYTRTTSQGEWTGGFSRFAHLPGGGLTRMQIHSWQTSPRLLKSVLPHELTHLIVNTNLKRYGDLPRALHEGLSVLMEPPFRHAYYRNFLRLRMKSKDFIPLDELLKMKDYPEDQDFFYAEGFALMDYLVKRHGMRAAFGLVRNAGKGSIEARLFAITGFKTRSDLQDDWKKMLAKGF